MRTTCCGESDAVISARRREGMQSSQQLYTALAHRYREHFDSPHRRAYDAMAWDQVRPFLPGRGPIVDVGCGVGRWVEPLLALGYEVIGIEPAPGMIAELRRADHGQAFKLISEPMETVQLPHGSAGMVLALGSLQYSADPEAMVRRFASLVDVQVTGLLASAAPLGPARLADRLERDWDAHLGVERELQAHPELADIGKQLLATGRRAAAGTGGRHPRGLEAGG